eukprot:1316662-Pyramimonas_sp.AAC.1
MPMATNAHRSDIGAEEKTFAKLATSETWLLTATTGQAKYSATAAAAQQQGCEYEPMAEIEQADGTSPPNTKVDGEAINRARYYNNHSKKKVVRVQLPERRPEEGPNCEEVRELPPVHRGSQADLGCLGGRGAGGSDRARSEPAEGGAADSCGFGRARWRLKPWRR